jgi:hypothetical protein
MTITMDNMYWLFFVHNPIEGVIIQWEWRHSKHIPQNIEKISLHINKKPKNIDCSTFFLTIKENQYWHEDLKNFGAQSRVLWSRVLRQEFWIYMFESLCIFHDGNTKQLKTRQETAAIISSKEPIYCFWPHMQVGIFTNSMWIHQMDHINNQGVPHVLYVHDCPSLS